MEKGVEREARTEGSRRRWSIARTAYVCTDYTEITVRHTGPDGSGQGIENVPRNVLLHRKDKSCDLALAPVVSGTEFARDFAAITMGAKDTKTFRSPATVREIVYRDFYKTSLREKILDWGQTNNADDALSVLNYIELDAGVFVRSAIESIKLSPALRSIDVFTFCCCGNLRQIEIPNGVEYIGKRCFKNSGIEEITLPCTLKEIDEYAFENCQNLKVVWMADGCTANVWEHVSSTVKVLPLKDTMVGDGLLWGLRGLRDVSIPEGFETIGAYWFSCSGIESVEIPSSVRKIDSYAFVGCRKLSRLTFQMAGKVGTDTGNLQKSQLRIIGADAFCSCAALTTVELPDGLEEIGKGAFCGSGLESITMPNSVQTIRQSAFCKCKSLRKAVLNEGLEVLGTNERTDDGRPWCGVFQESALESVKLSSTLKRIEYNAFKNCKNLKIIQLPTALEYIGKYSFSGAGPESVELSTPSKTDAQRAFANCESPGAVKFGQALKVSETSVTQDETAVSSTQEQAKVLSALKVIERSAFEGCRSLKYIQLPDGLEKNGANCFARSGLEVVVLPASVREVGVGAFYMCEQLREVKLNEGLEKLGAKETVDGEEYEGNVFAWSAIYSIRIPSTLKRIEERTFYHCRRIRCVDIQNGVEYIGKDCFADSCLEEITLPNTLKEFDKHMFDESRCLGTVWLEKGCKFEAWRYVYFTVSVGWKEQPACQEHENQTSQ